MEIRGDITLRSVGCLHIDNKRIDEVFKEFDGKRIVCDYCVCRSGDTACDRVSGMVRVSNGMSITIGETEFMDVLSVSNYANLIIHSMKQNR